MVHAKLTAPNAQPFKTNAMLQTCWLLKQGLDWRLRHQQPLASGRTTDYTFMRLASYEIGAVAAGQNTNIED